jgi:carboxymethylenebutenolidase
MKSESLTITSSGGSFQGYFTAPDSASVPGVIVIQEIFGVNSHIRSVCERLTEAGYAALAPDIFWRVQPGIELGYTADDIAKGRELKAKMNMDEVIEDVRAAFDVLGAQPECQGQKLGIIGFCYGGLISYTAATRLDPACASSYYGGGIVEYLNEADRLSCPIQFHFGEQDAAIPLDQVEQVRKAVSRKTNAEVFVYEGAGHGFHCDQRGSYNEASAKIAWERTLSLFGKYLA